MSGFDCELFVIGGGSGGVRAARIAAGHGARVLLAEEFRLGGTCVIRGCVPKKLYVYASRFAHEFAESAGFGWNLQQPAFDWGKLVAAKEAEITRLEGLYAKGQSSAGVEVVKSRAVLENAETVRILDGDRRIKARHVLIATGGRPQSLDVPGFEHAITSNEVFDLDVLPRRIVIAGGGYIACEFAGIFAGLGSEVTLIHRGDNVLRGFDDDLRNAVRDAYRQRGINLILNDTIAAIEGGEPRMVRTQQGQMLTADQVLVAVGRVPNIEGLGLDAAGVRLNASGAIAVDANSRTSAANIFAVGDVTGRISLTPVAIREGHAVADSLFGKKPWQADHSFVPMAVFSTPELGTIGLSEAAARVSTRIVDIYKADFRPMKATLSGASDRVMMKLVVDGETDRVLGAHVAGEGAGEMVQLLALSLRLGATKADFDATMALHPSAAEEFMTMRTRFARFASTA